MQYDMWRAVTKFVAEKAEEKMGLDVCYENIAFTPPNDQVYVKFDYIELPDQIMSLDRKCVSYMAMVQLSVILPPGCGASISRKVANDLSKSAVDGMILKVESEDENSPPFSCYVYEKGVVHPVQKSNSGWMIPVRFYVRHDDKGV